jgi:hypothetical protein
MARTVPREDEETSGDIGWLTIEQGIFAGNENRGLMPVQEMSWIST